jgi:hypothetical protein
MTPAAKEAPSGSARNGTATRASTRKGAKGGGGAAAKSGGKSGALVGSLLKALGLLMAASFVLPWDVALIPGPLPRINLQTENTQPLDTPEYKRDTVRFPSVEPGVECEAWLYQPKHPLAEPPPVVIMGHGLVRLMV